MKIEGPGKSSSITKTDKAKKAGGVKGASFSEYLTGADEVDETTPAAPLASVGMYAALQAAEHGTARQQRREAIDHADDLLNDLEDLRIGLITGNYTKTQMQNLAIRVQKRRATITDPALMALLEDIELRAAVELAKYE
jgi:hypothetical protein